MAQKKRKIVQDVSSVKVSAKQAKDALVMTAREYRKTPEGRKREAELGRAFTSSINPTLEVMEKVAQGFSEAMKRSQQAAVAAASILYREHLGRPLPPRLPVHIREEPQGLRLSEDDIERIAARAAEKLAQQAQLGIDAFVFTENNDLYREAMPSRVHHFRSKQRLEMFRAMLGRKSYRRSSEIQREAGYRSYDALTKAIHSLNTTLARDLQLLPGAAHRFIISHQPNGYMINPAYSVKQAKE